MGEAERVGLGSILGSVNMCRANKFSHMNM